MIAAVLALVSVMTSGPFTVTPNPCPQCPYRMRFSPDGRQGFVNVSRVSEADYPRMAERAFSLMRDAAGAKGAGTARLPADWAEVRAVVARSLGLPQPVVSKTGDVLSYEEETTRLGLWCMLSLPPPALGDVQTLPLATRELFTNPFLLAMRQHAFGARCSVVRHDGDVLVVVKDADRLGGTARFLALFNAGEKVEDLKVAFRDLGLAGGVEVLDLCDRADLGICHDVLTARLLPHGTRYFRLDAAKRVPSLL